MPEVIFVCKTNNSHASQVSLYASEDGVPQMNIVHGLLYMLLIYKAHKYIKVLTYAHEMYMHM